MKSHISSPIEQLGIYELTEHELEQVMGAQGYSQNQNAFYSRCWLGGFPMLFFWCILSGFFLS